MEFGVSALKGISANEHIADFVLYDYSNDRDQVLQIILGRLTTDVQSQFTTGWYTTHCDTCHCIRLSASSEYRQYCCCLLQSSVPPIAILWVPTFELVCTSYGFTFPLLCVWGGGWKEYKGGCVVWSSSGFTGLPLNGHTYPCIR